MVNKNHKQSASTFRKILVLQTAFLGDIVLTTPLLRVLYEAYPLAEIHFMTIPASQNVIETHPYIAHLWIFDKRGKDRGITGLFRMVLRLRSESFDLAVVPHRSIRSALLVFMAGIPVRIGFNRSAGAFLFSHQIKYPTQVHETERNLHLLFALGLNQPRKQLPELYPVEQDRHLVSEWLSQNGVGRGREVVALAPGSVWPTKRWPAGYWGKLASLLQHKEKTILLIGSRSDRFLIPEIMAHAGEGVLDAMGRFSLRQSAELISRCQLLISNDSAPTHLGVAVKTPVLTIFGPTVPGFGFFPNGEKDRVAEIKNLGCRPCSIHGGKKCPLSHFKCMLTLTPQTVFQIAERMFHEHCKD